MNSDGAPPITLRRHCQEYVRGRIPVQASRSRAIRAASARLAAPSLARMWDTCTPAVRTLMNRVCAISWLVRPQATCSRPSRSGRGSVSITTRPGAAAPTGAAPIRGTRPRPRRPLQLPAQGYGIQRHRRPVRLAQDLRDRAGYPPGDQRVGPAQPGVRGVPRHRYGIEAPRHVRPLRRLRSGQPARLGEALRGVGGRLSGYRPVGPARTSAPRSAYRRCATATNEVLPMPAGPDTTTVPPVPASAAAYAAASTASSASRPSTGAVPTRRACQAGPRPAVTPVTARRPGRRLPGRRDADQTPVSLDFDGRRYTAQVSTKHTA